MGGVPLQEGEIFNLHSSFSTILKDKTRGGQTPPGGCRSYIAPAKNNLVGNYITGFSDGESTFHISIYKNSKYKTG